MNSHRIMAFLGVLSFVLFYYLGIHCFVEFIRLDIKRMNSIIAVHKRIITCDKDDTTLELTVEAPEDQRRSLYVYLSWDDGYPLAPVTFYADKPGEKVTFLMYIGEDKQHLLKRGKLKVEVIERKLNDRDVVMKPISIIEIKTRKSE